MGFDISKLGEIFKKRPDRSGFRAMKPFEAPVSSDGVTEDSYSGLRTLISPTSSTPLLHNTNPQAQFRLYQNMRKANPLSFIGDVLSGDSEAPTMDFKFGRDDKETHPFAGLLDGASVDQMFPDGNEVVESEETLRNPNPRMFQNDTISSVGAQSDTLPQVFGLNRPIDTARGEYEAALAAPVKKKPWWADALYKGAVIASNAYQGATRGNQMLPVEGYGAAKKRQDVNKAYSKYAPLQVQEDAGIARDQKRAQIENIYADNAERTEARKNRESYLKSEQQRRIDEATNKRADTKMKTVAGMLAKIENYNPADPRFAEITKALGDVGLPIAPKDAKKKVQLIQDAETGAWTVTLTDPISGQQEVRPITNKDGSQLTTTSSSKVMANAAGERQVNQQAFQAGENEKNRKEALRKWAIDNQVTRARFKADLDSKVAKGEITPEAAAAALADFPTQ